MAKRATFVLERTLPDGTVRTWPDPMNRRQAAQCVAYCLSDNLGIRDAQTARRVEESEPGEYVDAHGYRFRLRGPVAP